MGRDEGVPRTRRSQWAAELDDLVRAVSGGFLFSIPLLYTMEVWWVGTFVNGRRMAIALVVTFVIVFLLNRSAGFRKGRRNRLADTLMETTQALSIGLVCTAGILFLLRRVTLETPPDEALGKVIYEAVPFALGVAVASQFLNGDRSQSEDGRGGPDAGGGGQGAQQGADSRRGQNDRSGLRGTLRDLGATVVGAMFIGFTIAPTAEVPMLAAGLHPPGLLALMAASLLLSYGIVFESGFADQRARRQQRGIFQRPISETIVSYLVSLLVAAGMLWFFRQFGLEDPWHMWLKYTIVLGLPAAVGGAAGRLAV